MKTTGLIQLVIERVKDNPFINPAQELCMSGIDASGFVWKGLENSADELTDRLESTENVLISLAGTETYKREYVDMLRTAKVLALEVLLAQEIWKGMQEELEEKLEQL